MQPRRGRAVLALVLFLVIYFCFQFLLFSNQGATENTSTASSAPIHFRETPTMRHSDPDEVVVVEGPPRPLSSSDSVHVFFYAWYGNPEHDGSYFHWNHQVLPHWEKRVNQRHPAIGTYFDPARGDIGADFYPMRGTYSSRDESTIRSQFISLREIAGVNVIALSFWGQRGADGQGKHFADLLDLYFHLAEDTGMKICMHLEPYPNRSPQSVRSDLEFLIQRFGSSPAFYRVSDAVLRGVRMGSSVASGRQVPLVYVYDSYHTPSREWSRLLSPSGDLSIRGTEMDAVFVSLFLDQGKSGSFSVESNFDGIYTYFAATRFTQGSTPGKWASIASWAEQNSLLFVPSVGPGYQDKRIRPWNGMNVRSRENGAYYERMWTAALETKPVFVSITSYNEWHEGTQIEEVQGMRNEDGTFEYVDYGDRSSTFYLEETARFITRFESQTEDG